MHGLYFSATAYCSKEDILNWDCGSICEYHPGFKAVNVYNYMLLGESSQVYTGYSEAAKKFVVAFQGSHNTGQIIEEVIFSGQEEAEFAPGKKYWIEKYFWDVYSGLSNIRKSIMTDVNQFQSQFADYDFFITGHSLGGALASICAMDLVLSGTVPSEKLMKYTFGEPRSGNEKWAIDFDNYVPNSYRVVHAADLIPHVPPEYGDLGWKYKHASQEIWYNEACTNYTACGPNEDPNCSDSTHWLERNMEDHKHYFHIPDMGHACGKNITTSI